MTSRFLRLVLLWFAALTLAAGPGFAQGKGHGEGKGHAKHDKGDEGNEGKRGKYAFSAHDREIVGGYFSGHVSNLPPGLAKRGGNLPPGLEKQLARNGTLPPGLQKRLQPCPVELERQLTPLPADYRRGFIGAHLVIFNKNTNLIVDVMKDVY